MARSPALLASGFRGHARVVSARDASIKNEFMDCGYWCGRFSKKLNQLGQSQRTLKSNLLKPVGVVALLAQWHLGEELSCEA
jgi:hypothetical protein